METEKKSDAVITNNATGELLFTNNHLTLSAILQLEHDEEDEEPVDNTQE